MPVSIRRFPQPLLALLLFTVPLWGQETTSDSTQTASGIVFHDKNGNGKFDDGEKPLPGVAVSNGLDVVKTDDQGRYELPVTDDTILFVIQPQGYKSPLSEDLLPRFYYIHKPEGSPPQKYPGVKPTGPLPDSVDFPLTENKEADQYQVLMFGDTQPRDQKEVDWIGHDVLAELVDNEAAFGVTLGDIAFDNLETLEPLNRAIALLKTPWINVIGNHDLNFDAKIREHANETFEQIYGPSYYSFDWGPVHYVVIDNIEWIYEEEKGRGRYQGGIGERQLEFVKNDLKHVDKDKLVVLMMHIPLTNTRDRQELYRLIEDRPNCVSFSAHTHRHAHILIGEEDGWQGESPHLHINQGTVCGSWWSGAHDERGIPHATMSDGTPNGYGFLKIDGNQFKLDYKAAGRKAEYQMEIDAPDLVKTSEKTAAEVYVNFFNGTDNSRVQMKVGDADWADMEQARERDPKFQRAYDREEELLKNRETAPFRRLPKPAFCAHLWKSILPADLPPGTHLIQIKGTDHWNREFEAKRVIRVEE